MHKHLFDNAKAGELIVSGDKVLDCNLKGLKDLGYESFETIRDLPLSQISGDMPSQTWIDDHKHPFRTWELRQADGATIRVYAQVFATQFDDREYLCIQWYQQDACGKLKNQIFFKMWFFVPSLMRIII